MKKNHPKKTDLQIKIHKKMKKTVLNSVENFVMAVLATVLTMILFAAATSCAKANTKAKDWTAKTSFASL